MTNDELLQQTYDARDRFARTLGDVSPDLLAPLLNPTFSGGPTWPQLRQAWRVIRRGSNTLIMSDGLSDPFSEDAEPNAGFGLEVLAETPDAMPAQLQQSWLLDLVYQVAQQCAHHGGVRGLVDRLGLISLELPLSNVLQPVATPNDTAGVLLGVVPDFPTEFAVPGGSVRIVTAKLLWPSELAYAAENGKAAREDLARRFTADGSHHRSSLQRKPVI